MKWSGIAALLLASVPAQAKPGVINYSPWHLESLKAAGLKYRVEIRPAA